MRSVEKAALAALLLSLVIGCSAPVQMSLRDSAPAPVVKKADATRQPVVFAPLVDQRPDFQRESAGSVGGREITAKEAAHWIDRSLQKLSGRHFKPGRPDDPAAWQITPRLRQLYAASVRVSKSANIVIELEIRPPGGEPVTRIIRGRITAVNWWNSADEIEAAVGDALKDCLQRMSADIDQVIVPGSA
jgi:uncharacterized lipoprotein YajG